MLLGALRMRKLEVSFSLNCTKTFIIQELEDAGLITGTRWAEKRLQQNPLSRWNKADIDISELPSSSHRRQD